MVFTLLLRERVLANVSASMARPRPDRPYEGTITIHTELSPMASAIYETGRYVRLLTLTFQLSHFGSMNRSSEEEVIITRMIEKIIRRSEAVDREALCILAGQQVCAAFVAVRWPTDQHLAPHPLTRFGLYA